jgi:tRNA uridine 5-carboxymethylaminomethyl modification enzyme
MFTSRAEFRLLLREDNADLRLTPIGRRLGLVDDARWAAFEERREAVARGLAWAQGSQLRPSVTDSTLAAAAEPPLAKPVSVAHLLRRPSVDWDLAALCAAASQVEPAPLIDAAAVEQVVIECRYHGYIKRQRQEVERIRSLGASAIPEGFAYAGIPGLRTELVEKLTSARPATLGEAARIPGVTPAAVALLARRL